MLLGDANKKEKNQSKEKWKDIPIYRIIVSFMWKQNLEVLIDEMSNNYEVTGLNILYFCNFPSKALNLVL